jgi:hypothetical protein
MKRLRLPSPKPNGKFVFHLIKDDSRTAIVLRPVYHGHSLGDIVAEIDPGTGIELLFDLQDCLQELGLLTARYR